MIILIKADSDELIKCSSCLEIGKLAARHPTDNRKVCQNCINQMRSTLLTFLEWRIYKTIESLQHKPNFVVLTAQSLGLDYKKVKAIACRLKEKGLKCGYSPKTFTVNGITLTEIEYLIYQSTNTWRSLINLNYAAKTSHELGINKHTVVHYLDVLKQKGFHILSSSDRSNNLKEFVLEQMKITQKPKAEFIKHMVKVTGFKRQTIRHIVNEHENKGVEIKRGFAIQEILKIVGDYKEIELNHLRSLLPYHPSFILQTVRRLERTGKVQTRRVHVRKIFISLPTPTPIGLTVNHPLLKFPHPLEAV
ncbi:hypothetical protein ACX27_27335 [Nostoc piscinale CENA21]|uniref:Uncharacterized protein n=1 Tax=Nostoc piscinale CENA21 TaxID=224013 RepID=A0A0M5MHV2_9NOSO|nr:hypothetical protein [Nostoc piscinale]ALF55725.1 hypothetical protein ACX27_27335 [Nostoc piscinale CENA21]